MEIELVNPIDRIIFSVMEEAIVFNKNEETNGFAVNSIYIEWEN